MASPRCANPATVTPALQRSRREAGLTLGSPYGELTSAILAGPGKNGLADGRRLPSGGLPLAPGHGEPHPSGRGNKNNGGEARCRKTQLSFNFRIAHIIGREIIRADIYHRRVAHAVYALATHDGLKAGNRICQSQVLRYGRVVRQNQPGYPYPKLACSVQLAPGIGDDPRQTAAWHAPYGICRSHKWSRDSSHCLEFQYRIRWQQRCLSIQENG